MAAVSAAIAGLDEGAFDAVITGGIDANMSASTFVKFCKIGALSATGSRPYADGADGFVMGEGAAVFLLKRLADAERDGDRVYAVLRGMGGERRQGQGITARPRGPEVGGRTGWRSGAALKYRRGGPGTPSRGRGQVGASWSLPRRSPRSIPSAR
jgi:3-oxoacyl-(acyl-carrier-protein) synthase